MTESQLNFIEDKSEWTGTDIVFEIIPLQEHTQLIFTHVGLVPDVECFSACSDAWSMYIKKSLYNFITAGEAQPQ